MFGEFATLNIKSVFFPFGRNIIITRFTDGDRLMVNYVIIDTENVFFDSSRLNANSGDSTKKERHLSGFHWSYTQSLSNEQENNMKPKNRFFSSSPKVAIVRKTKNMNTKCYMSFVNGTCDCVLPVSTKFSRK